jgi:hypothetical protein
MGSLPGEFFVIGQIVRTHAECAYTRVIGQGDGDGRGLAALGALQVDEVTDGGQVRGIFGERGAQRSLESVRAVRIEQLDEAAGERTEICAA